jgi:hypothetical protein
LFNLFWRWLWSCVTSDIFWPSPRSGISRGRRPRSVSVKSQLAARSTALLADTDDGIRLCEHIEDVEGAVVFRQACVMGLEGIVAKRRDSRYRSGRCREWIKIKNPAHPAIERAMLIALSQRVQR